ncbi:hypothetical protein G6F42_026464 [Rhizopus arrhizus]|nr:hypothetical protein G6F42_026464 [Rhizopus arrhizus]
MFTRWPMAVATKKADAITAATFLYEEVFTKFGPLTTILSENGSHFANQVLEEYIELCITKHKFGTTPYHPENQGMLTLMLGALTLTLSCMRTESDPMIESIGISPYELMFGVVPNDPADNPILSFGRKLGFDRLLAIPDMRNEIITKNAKERSLNPPNDTVIPRLNKDQN